MKLGALVAFAALLLPSGIIPGCSLWQPSVVPAPTPPPPAVVTVTPCQRPKRLHRHDPPRHPPRPRPRVARATLYDRGRLRASRPALHPSWRQHTRDGVNEC